jgi:sugar phosphate isomerase/epimerase
MKIGIQMWSIHDVCKNEGFQKSFELVGKMGYQGWEFALGDKALLSERMGTRIDIDDLKKAASDNGIELLGSHISMQRLLENPKPILDECLKLGLSYAAIGPAFYGDREPFADQKAKYADVKRISKLFKDNGIQFQVHGSAFGYLRDYRGRRTIDGMIEECGVENLQPEFDTAWMICGGVLPTEYLRKYKGHVDILHFKDFHPPMEDSDYILVRHNNVADHWLGCAVGDNGIQDLGTIVPVAHECGTKWLLVELWNEQNSLENAKISIDNLKKHV